MAKTRRVVMPTLRLDAAEAGCISLFTVCSDVYSWVPAPLSSQSAVAFAMDAAAVVASVTVVSRLDPAVTNMLFS